MAFTDEAPAIEVIGLTKVYKQVTAVDGISFAIPRGSITGILGGNGAGKTTTIGMILGLILPTSGAIRVLGTDMLADRHRVLHRIEALIINAGLMIVCSYVFLRLVDSARDIGSLIAIGE